MTMTARANRGTHQAHLPLFAQVEEPDVSGVAVRAFAHPAEQELARILTFFGLRWAYEPTTFALKRHPDGTISEAFSPDFFLPDLHLYLELTTMQQKLVTKKNRKARLLRELYPNVRLRLIYRRDFLRMMECFRGELRRSDRTDLAGIVRTEQQIALAVDTIAHRLAARVHRAGTSSETPIVLAITNRGARRFQQDVAAALHGLGIATSEQTLELVGDDTLGAKRRIRATASALRHLQQGPVVLLETLVSTGLTVGHAQRWMQERGVPLIGTMALFSRSSSLIGHAQLDHVAFDAPNDVIAGYGLQLHATHADLPYVARVRANSAEARDLLGEIVAEQTTRS